MGTTSAICSPRRPAAATCCSAEIPLFCCRRGGGLAGAEDRRADPDIGRAKADRGLEIGAHPPAELVEPVALCGLAQQRGMPCRLLVLGPHAPEPRDPKAE